VVEGKIGSEIVKEIDMVGIVFHIMSMNVDPCIVDCDSGRRRQPQFELSMGDEMPVV
jgi:hypothetical protein